MRTASWPALDSSQVPSSRSRTLVAEAVVARAEAVAAVDPLVPGASRDRGLRDLTSLGLESPEAAEAAAVAVDEDPSSSSQTLQDAAEAATSGRGPVSIPLLLDTADAAVVQGRGPLAWARQASWATFAASRGKVTGACRERGDKDAAIRSQSWSRPRGGWV